MKNIIGKKKLYIIGNGFDLHHGMNTSYHAFSKYLFENDPELLNLFDSYFSYEQTDDDLWCRFEENLANIDTDSLLEDHKDYLPDFASDEFRDRDMHAFPDTMQHILDKLTSDLISNFTSFVREVKIGNYAKEHKLNLDIGSAYLTFNYTYTLEDLYVVDSDNILHIHNGCEARYVDIILGHGLDPELNNINQEIEEPPDNLSDEELAEWYEHQSENYDYSFDTGKDNIEQYLSKSYKPTQKIIEENESFFRSLGGIEEVFIFGQSLGEVDIPYFQEIIKSINPSAKWTISYYADGDEIIFKEKLKNLGISQNNIETTKLEYLEVDPNQLAFPFPE